MFDVLHVRHDNARRRAVDAIKQLDQGADAVSFSAVAAAASVSRGWLYRQDDLRVLIMHLRPTGTTHTSPQISAHRASLASIRERLDAARIEITDLRAQNAALRDQVARRLGEQRAKP